MAWVKLNVLLGKRLLCSCVCVYARMSQTESDSELDISCYVFRRGWSIFSACVCVQSTFAVGDRFGGQRNCVRAPENYCTCVLFLFT